MNDLAGAEQPHVDLDTETDALALGLPAAVNLAGLHPGRGDVEAIEAFVDSDPPPTSSALSPMGQVEHFGDAIRHASGWRRTVIEWSVWAALAAAIVLAIAGFWR